MSSWARMQPVGKSGQSEQTGFLNQDGNSCNRVSHGNRIRESGAVIQFLGVQLNYFWGLFFIFLSLCEPEWVKIAGEMCE